MITRETEYQYVFPLPFSFSRLESLDQHQKSIFFILILPTHHLSRENLTSTDFMWSEKILERPNGTWKSSVSCCIGCIVVVVANRNHKMLKWHSGMYHLLSATILIDDYDDRHGNDEGYFNGRDGESVAGMTLRWRRHFDDVHRGTFFFIDKWYISSIFAPIGIIGRSPPLLVSNIFQDAAETLN